MSSLSLLISLMHPWLLKVFISLKSNNTHIKGHDEEKKYEMEGKTIWPCFYVPLRNLVFTHKERKRFCKGTQKVLGANIKFLGGVQNICERTKKHWLIIFHLISFSFPPTRPIFGSVNQYKWSWNEIRVSKWCQNVLFCFLHVISL